MSRLYDMRVMVKGFNPKRRKQIIRACVREWDFDPGEFVTPAYAVKVPEMSTSAAGYLCGGEMEHEFANRLARAIWKANGGYCEVELGAACLENMPYEKHTFSRKDYTLLTERSGWRWRRKKN